MFPLCLSLSHRQASNSIDVAGRPGGVPHTLLQKDPRVSIRPVASWTSLLLLCVPWWKPHIEKCECIRSGCLKEWMKSVNRVSKRCNLSGSWITHFGYSSMLLMILIVGLSIQITDPYRTSVRVSGRPVHVFCKMFHLSGQATKSKTANYSTTPDRDKSGYWLHLRIALRSQLS